MNLIYLQIYKKITNKYSKTVFIVFHILWAILANLAFYGLIMLSLLLTKKIIEIKLETSFRLKIR